MFVNNKLNKVIYHKFSIKGKVPNESLTPTTPRHAHTYAHAFAHTHIPGVVKYFHHKPVYWFQHIKAKLLLLEHYPFLVKVVLVEEIICEFDLVDLSYPFNSCLSLFIPTFRYLPTYWFWDEAKIIDMKEIKIKLFGQAGNVVSMRTIFIWFYCCFNFGTWW